MLWTCDRFWIALKMLDAAPDDFKGWYLQNHRIDRREFSKNIRSLLKAKTFRREGRYHKEFVRFALDRRPHLAERIKAILVGTVDFAALADQTGFSFGELAAINGVSAEFKRLADAVGRQNINRVKLHKIHAARRDFVERYICGNFDLYRNHSQVQGLVVDGICFSLDGNGEISCNAYLYHVSGHSDQYEGRALFDGKKLIVLLTKVEARHDYVDSVKMLIVFSETYRRYAAIISASVDQNEDTICAARAVLVPTVELRTQSKVLDSGLSKSERRLQMLLDNNKPIHQGGDRVLMFNNLTLNAQN